MRFIGHSAPAQTADASYRPRLGTIDLPFSAAPLEEAPPDKVDWMIYVRSILKRRWAIAALAVVSTLLATLYAQSITPTFRSTSTMLIEAGKAKILSIEEVYNAISQDREYYQTQVEILRSREVALRTVVATKLWDQPEFDPRKPTRSWQGQIKDFMSPPPPPPVWTEESLAEATVGKFQGAISIEPVRLSQLVKISFEAADKDLAAKVADATALSFIAADRDARLKLNQSVNGLLQDRMVALRERLKQSEDELQRFRESSGLVSVSGSQGVASQQMVEIGQRLVAARVRRTELESAFQQIDRVGDGEVLGSSAALYQPGLTEARNRVSTAQLQLDEVSRVLGDQHSRVIEARTVLAAAQRELMVQSRAAVSSLRREAAAARETERSLQAALSSAKSAVQSVNRQEFQLGVLEREVQANRQLYELFLSRTKETGVSTNLQAAVARIVDPGRPATAPLRPNKPQIVGMALLLALLVGSAASIVIDKLAATLQGSEEAENRLQQPVLAALPKVTAAVADNFDSTFLHAPRSQHADAIRKARTKIVLSDMLLAHKVMLVTSSVDGEGKTSFCTNLGLALAQARRTLLIDCDLRNPEVGVRLGLPAHAKGICDVGRGTAELKECVHNVPGSTLLVMPAGEVPDHPEELLLTPRFREALRSLASRVDIVLIDSPPVSTSSDALIIAQLADDTIYVVKARDTPLAMAHKGLEQLRRAGASILGVVLTNTDPPDAKVRRTARSSFAHRRDTAAATATVVDT